MCGIAGLITTRERLNPKTFENVLQAIRHRGPDGEGILAFDSKSKRAVPLSGPDSEADLNLPLLTTITPGDFDVLLGQRRLSIIDLSLNGHQPMNYGGRYWITFNGEIYNYIELRQELIAKGYEFHTASDTEVAIAAYACWGEDMLNKFIGMFAFAILDTEENNLFIARDFFGIKPFFYYKSDEQFAFASEIKALLQIPEVSRKANNQRMYDYLAMGYSDAGEESFFEHIHVLPPAHCMTVDLKTRKVSPARRYWSVDREARSTLSFKAAADELRERFLENIRLHLRSDVPVGACLSGGVDSSAIVMAMRHVGGKSLDIHTFTYVADNEAVSEEKWADLVSEASGSVHHKIRPGASNMIVDISPFVNIQGEPFSSTNMYVQYLVFRLAKEAGIKVMLDGQGSDEMLGGYLHYLSFRVASSLASGKLGEAYRLLTYGTHDRAPFRKSVPKESAYLMLPAPVRQALLRKNKGPKDWMDADWFARSNIQVEPQLKPGGRNAFRDSLRDSLEVRGIISLLRYEDRSSMANSIESRVPFLTPSFASFIASLPDSYLIDRDGNTKCVFKAAMRGIVPDEILDRRDKIGFLTPEKQWFTELKPWIDQVLSGANKSTAPFLVPEFAKAELNRILQGGGSYRSTVWRWLNALYWSEVNEVTF